MADAVILGGGPAGATAALTLARTGREVVLVDAGAPGAVRIGEALPPAARPLLGDLGLLEAVARGGHLPCSGNVAAWAGPVPVVHDFLLDPNGSGWHLDRRRFDEDLRRAAAEAGAQVLRRTRAIELERTGDRWRLRLRRADGTEIEASFDWLVDATGRGSVFARRLGSKRRRQDRLVALVAHFRPAAAPDHDSRTWVEATPDGWWYTAPLPGGERIVAFHTDADLVSGTAPRTTAGFTASLASARNLSALLATRHYEIAGPPRGLDAASAHLDHAVGDRWLAVGDAALSFDPISSQGLLNALYTGLRGAQAVDQALGGAPGAPAAYAARLRAIRHAYRGHYTGYYAGAAQRWPEQPFWEPRAAAAPGPKELPGPPLGGSQLDSGKAARSR